MGRLLARPYKQGEKGKSRLNDVACDHSNGFPLSVELLHDDFLCSAVGIFHDVDAFGGRSNLLSAQVVA